MKRSDLRRTSWMKRGTKRIGRNRKRSAENFDRAYGGVAKVEWLKSQPCAVSGVRGDIECAHVKNGGMSRKADAKWLIPLATELHRLLHRIGRASFEARFLVDLERLAEETERKWRLVA